MEGYFSRVVETDGTAAIRGVFYEASQLGEALTKRERFHQVLLEKLTEGVVACDTQGQLQIFNKTARDWHGSDPRSMPQDEWSEYYDLYHLDGKTLLTTEDVPLVRAWRGENVRNVPICIVAKGQAPRYVTAAGGPLMDDDGTPMGALVVMHDVTQEQTAARKAIRLQLQLRELIEAAPDGIVMIDAEGLIKVVNRQVEVLFGRSRTELEGRSISELGLKNGDREFGASCRTMITDGAREASRTPLTLKVKGKNAQGERISLNAYIRPVDMEEQVWTAVTLRDVTAEEISGQRMRRALMLLESISQGAIAVDVESLKFVYVNNGVSQLLGYSHHEMMTKSLQDMLSDEAEGELRAAMDQLNIQEQSGVQATIEVCANSGDRIPVEMDLQRIEEDEEQPLYIAVITDLRDRLRSERENRRKQRLESLGELAGGVAHDLNNALAPILLSVQMLRQMYPDEDDVLEVIEANTKRGAQMIHQLLTFAKGREGESVPIEPMRLVNEIEKMARGTFPKDIQIHIKGRPGGWKVCGDPTQLYQVLLNLCVNARDAMPDGGQLHISIENLQLDSLYAKSVPETAPGKYVVFRVSDTGVGMAPDVMDRIYEPFFTTKDPNRGTGLGLSTAVGILRSHKGSIQVYSEAGKGTRFVVYVPALNSEEKEPEDREEPPVELRGQDQTILVVDDEQSVRQIATDVLVAKGFNVITACDGADALIKVGVYRDELTLVLTDMHMPNMDGKTFIRALRRVSPKTAVVVMGGRIEIKDQQTFKKLKVQGLLTKPFTERELASVLAAAMDKSNRSRGRG